MYIFRLMGWQWINQNALFFYLFVYNPLNLTIVAALWPHDLVYGNRIELSLRKAALGLISNGSEIFCNV